MCKRNQRAIKALLVVILLFFMVWFSLPMAALRVRDSAVMVHIEVCGFHYGQASGVIIDKGVILTAGHVVRSAEVIHITTDDGVELVSTEFIKADDIDLGLIIFDSNEVLPHSKLSFCEPYVGQTVFGIGSRYGLFNSFFKGVTSAKGKLVPMFGNKGLLQLDIAGNPGDSGCAIYNRWGSVVGILVGGGGDGITFCVPSKICKLFLTKYKVDKAFKDAK